MLSSYNKRGISETFLFINIVSLVLYTVEKDHLCPLNSLCSENAMSARSSLEMKYSDRQSLFSNETELRDLQPKRGFWERFCNHVPGFTWILILGNLAQLLLLFQMQWQLCAPTYSVRVGDDASGLSPKCEFFFCSPVRGITPRFILEVLIIHPTNDMSVSSQVLHEKDHIDFYITNYTSDDDMAILQRRWEDLLPRVLFLQVNLSSF
jgi:hypothetical protein